MRWNTSQAGDIDKLRMDTEDIWVPDIEVYNRVSRKGLRDREQVNVVFLATLIAPHFTPMIKSIGHSFELV